ncbi:MAG: hypothetical protein JXR83_21580 [Deltaproteobacteria bacterium]|nr:hypothetical protein [Deltaproteobacteria bacterium]
MLGVWSLLTLGLLLGQPEPATRPAPAERFGQVDSAPSYPLVMVVPIGKVAPDLTAFIVESVRRRFYFEVQAAPAVSPAAAAWYAPRKRWRAERLLDQLDGLEAGDAFRVIGLTELPISTTKGEIFDWGIAGLGRLPGKSCVLTAYLFRGLKKKDRPHYLRYLENLVLHELGHTLGLDHCPLDRCIMADAKGNALRAARASSNEFCPRCHAKLQRWLRASEVQGDWKSR